MLRSSNAMVGPVPPATAGAPSTPRQPRRVRTPSPPRAPASSPPATPRAPKIPFPGSPPPAPRPTAEPLLRGLHDNSAERVLAVLRRDPGAAREPLFGAGMEPPLCAAVRLGCSENIVRLLLDHGADARWADAAGREPLHVLSMCQPPWNFPSGITAADAGEWVSWASEYETKVATMLLNEGACAASAMVKGGAETSSLRIAQHMGKSYLVDLYRSRMVQ